MRTKTFINNQSATTCFFNEAKQNGVYTAGDGRYHTAGYALEEIYDVYGYVLERKWPKVGYVLEKLRIFARKNR
jgi:hypothetical protein